VRLSDGVADVLAGPVVQEDIARARFVPLRNLRHEYALAA
jgi:hypothetical protein